MGSPVYFVHPQADELIGVVQQIRGRHEQDAADDAGEISQVEHVVGLGGRRQERLDRLVVNGHGGFDHHLSCVLECMKV